MKKVILLFCFFLTANLLQAQNLVLNPSFEETDHCVTEGDANKYQNIPSLLLSQCRNWNSFSPQGTADLFQPCNTFSFSSLGQNIKARTGIASAGFYIYDRIYNESEYREYLVGKLKAPMERGKNYQVSFWIKLNQKSGYASSALGVYFSQDTVYRMDDFYGTAPFQPQWQNLQGNFLTNKQQWTEIRFNYKADGGESYLMIGNFLEDAKTDTIHVGSNEKRDRNVYLHIDDICVSMQDCNSPIILPQYRFRTMVYDAKNNKPIVDAQIEMNSVENPSARIVGRTEKDSKGRLSLPEGEYLCYIKADCYLPKIDFYSIPIIQNGQKLPEQMQYSALRKIQKGNKVVIYDDLTYTIADMKIKREELYERFLLRLDKYADFLKENPSLKVSINSAIYMRYVSTEEKKIEVKNKQTTNLEFIRNYWISKGVKADQLTTQFVEITKEHLGAGGSVDGRQVGGYDNRYELEVIETSCKSDPDAAENATGFFHRNEKGAIYILDKVYFAPDSPELEQRSFEELDRLAEFLKQHPDLKIRINGHTDIGKANGSIEFLQKLSDNRAKSVADYLVSKGAKKSNITSQGYANRKPIADNNTEEGKAKNRRVEVEIVE